MGGGATSDTGFWRGDREGHLDRVFHVVGIVTGANARGDETEGAIEGEGRLVGAANLEEDRLPSARSRKIDGMGEERMTEPAPAKLGQGRHRKDVQLVAHEPSQEKRSRRRFPFWPREEEVRPRVFELRLHVDGRFAETRTVDGRNHLSIEAARPGDVDHGRGAQAARRRTRRDWRNWYRILQASNEPTTTLEMISRTVRWPSMASRTSCSCRVSFSEPRASTAT